MIKVYLDGRELMIRPEPNQTHTMMVKFGITDSEWHQLVIVTEAEDQER